MQMVFLLQSEITWLKVSGGYVLATFLFFFFPLKAPEIFSSFTFPSAPPPQNISLCPDCISVSI